MVLERLLDGSGVWSGPADLAASGVVAEGEVYHDGEPDEAGDDEKPGEARAVTDVHEEKDHEKSFGDGNGQGSDDVEDTEVELSDEIGGEEEEEKGEPDESVRFAGSDGHDET